ncbi:hypothetical protein D781_2044 [Serratia sp. FGI94]|uniref:hypothetical protein n=1 Tax=Serratia sp. FGI94 TaxID=671990 RepID=UPI0002A6FFBD|nr:hypothetical protein [Serratia sp. FGI94]AGB82324.1 hypothetical protein D781_2044 [Serratia sp. FGI94]
MLNIDLERRGHIYFCLLIALALSRKQGRVKTVRQKHAFIIKWLKNAGEKRLFGHQAGDEIAWLKTKIRRSGPDNDPEPMLRFIYHTTCALQTPCGLK